MYSYIQHSLSNTCTLILLNVSEVNWAYSTLNVPHSFDKALLLDCYNPHRRSCKAPALFFRAASTASFVSSSQSDVGFAVSCLALLWGFDILLFSDTSTQTMDRCSAKPEIQVAMPILTITVCFKTLWTTVVNVHVWISKYYACVLSDSPWTEVTTIIFSLVEWSSSTLNANNILILLGDPMCMCIIDEGTSCPH